MKNLFLSSIFIIFFTGSSLASTILVSADTATEKWGVFELTVSDNGVYNNPFWDATIAGQFNGPAGEHFFVEGFYYDSNLWKIRFSPTAIGVWNYTINFTGASGTTTFIDSFVCFNPSINNHGFIHVNPNALHSFIQDDSTLFIPIGTNGNCPVVTAAMLGIPSNPSEVESMWDSLASNHINTYRFFMFNQPEFPDSILWCPTEGSANLFYNTSALDQYSIRCGKLIDRWFEQTNEHGIAIYLNMSSFSAFPFNSSPWSLTNGGFYSSEDDMYSDSTGPGMAYQKKYAAYIVNRWGSYRNMLTWEYNNEYGARSSLPWLQMMDSVINAHENYNRSHTVSFWNFSWSQSSPVNASPYVTVTDDHLYKFNGLTEFTGDSAANNQSRYRFSNFNKPVVFSEFGCGSECSTSSDVNYERVTYWGAFMGGGTPLLWQSGGNYPNGWVYNINDLHFLNGVSKVTKRLQHYEKMSPSNQLISVQEPTKERGYCFANSCELLAYLHHYDDHSNSIIGSNVIFTFPNLISFSYDAVWINPATGDSIYFAQGNSSGNAASLIVPDFQVDILEYVKLKNIVIGINEPQAITSSLVVYPNPCQQKFNIELPAQKTFDLQIFDLMGRKIYGKKNAEGIIQIDCSNFYNGVYIIDINSEKWSEKQKLIIQR